MNAKKMEGKKVSFFFSSLEIYAFLASNLNEWPNQKKLRNEKSLEINFVATITAADNANADAADSYNTGYNANALDKGRRQHRCQRQRR